MNKVEKIKNIIHKSWPVIKEKYRVKSMGIFGSYLTDKTSKKSDIDLLVEFSAPIDLFEFVGLENFLSEKLGKKVDLVMKGALKPRIKDRILRQAVSI